MFIRSVVGRPARALVWLCTALCPTLLVAQTGTIGLNFTGVTLADGMTLTGNGGYAPPDLDGAVGPSQVAQLINGAFAVYDKSTGAQQELISGRQFWINAGVDPGTSINNLGVFNQRILYDPTTSRWIAAALTGESINNNVLIARSDTSDPSGGWKAVGFLGNNGTGDKFVDFTTLGLDANGVYVTTNNYPQNGPEFGFGSISVFSLPKTDLLATTPTIAHMTRFDGLDTGYGNALQPIVDLGAAKNHAPLLSSFPGANSDFYFRNDLTGTAAAGATFNDNPTYITTGAYNNPPAAAQPDGTRSISTIDARIGATVTQIGNTIYAVHSTSVAGNAAIKWVKINEQTSTVIQEGILSDPNFDYFMPSIGVNPNGDMVIGFTRSGGGAGGNLSAFAVVGKTTGAVTLFGTPFLLKAGMVNDYHYFNGRWGDYTSTVVDPSNPNVFWTFQEYALSSDAWATQITQITVPEPSSVALAATGVTLLAAAAWRRRRAEARRVMRSLL
jgi:hypothetical protein